MIQPTECESTGCHRKVTTLLYVVRLDDNNKWWGVVRFLCEICKDDTYENEIRREYIKTGNR